MDSQNTDAKNLFGSLFCDSGVCVRICRENTRRVCYCDKTRRVTDEKYILQITATDSGFDVCAVCSGNKSAFYALCDLERRVRTGTLCAGEFVCSPLFVQRGYIEGFYGTPWTAEQRKQVLLHCAKRRMNTVYYAPKDDPYHREKWRELYPQAQLQQLKDLADTAKAYYMDFYWCVAPGLSMQYSDPLAFESLCEKTRQLYAIGIRHFGLLLDDIDEELSFAADRECYGETVNAHIDLAEKYHTFLCALDAQCRLTVCPTLYHGEGDEYYIAKLGQNISPLISVFWTGREICSKELTSLQAIRFAQNVRRKPLYWDNYPVNDCSMFNEMHLSPLINRDPDLWKYSEGIIANCMEYAAASCIPLATVADYLWDSEHYDPQKSWEDAVACAVGADMADSFITFADHLYTSCLKDSNSRRLYALLDRVETAVRADDRTQAAALLALHIAKMDACADYLQKDLPLCRELAKWAEKFFVLCELMHLLLSYLQTKDEDLLSQMLAIGKRFSSIPAKLGNDVNFEEEIKNLQRMDF